MNALASSSRSGTVSLASRNSRPRFFQRATAKTAAAASSRRSIKVKRNAALVCRASSNNDNGKGTAGALLSAASAAVDAASSLVPESVPRPVAKGAVAAVGGLLVISLVGKVISTVVFLGLLAAGGYFLLQQQQGDGQGGGGGGGGGGKGGGSGSGSDALEEARRIMEKYK